MRRGRVFSGSSHWLLTQSICERLGIRPSECDVGKFSNGETSVNIGCSIRDQEIFIVQTGGKRVNDSIMELLILIQACKGGSASKIYAVLPYFPYSRQSKKKAHRGGITARMLANLLSISGVHHVITVDLHMQGFFQVPVDNLRSEPLFAAWIKQNVPNYKDCVVVSKNPGGTKRVTSLADTLHLSFGIVTTERIRNLSTMNSSVIWEKPELREEADSPETTTTEKEQPSTPTKETTHSRDVSATSTLSVASTPSRPGISRAQTSPLPILSDKEEEYTDQRAEFITGRLVQGRIVDDNYPSPALSMNGSVVTLPQSPFVSTHDHDPMMSSILSTTSSIALPEHALRGSLYHEEESEEEEEQLLNPINELTITLVGNVRDKTVFILDDMIDQAGTWIAAAECVSKRGGAKTIYCMATHGLFGDDALQQLQDCECIDYIVVTNTLPIEVTDRITKLRVIDISSLLSEAMRRNHYGESLSLLYNNFTI